jgi:hypothetical protein
MDHTVSYGADIDDIRNLERLHPESEIFRSTRHNQICTTVASGVQPLYQRIVNISNVFFNHTITIDDELPTRCYQTFSDVARHGDLEVWNIQVEMPLLCEDNGLQ